VTWVLNLWEIFLKSWGFVFDMRGLHGLMVMALDWRSKGCRSKPRRGRVVIATGWESEGPGLEPRQVQSRAQTPAAPGNFWPTDVKKITSDPQPKTVCLSWKKNSQGALWKIKKKPPSNLWSPDSHKKIQQKFSARLKSVPLKINFAIITMRIKKAFESCWY